MINAPNKTIATNPLVAHLDLERVKDLSDGIFSFAMTLLILGIQLPEIPEDVTNREILQHVANQWPAIATYVISFMNIGGYWMLHNSAFSYLNNTNRTLLQLNLLFLLTVTFLPFPTGLQGVYGKLPSVALVYGITITLNYAMLILVTRYAYSKPELCGPDLTVTVKKILALRLLLPLILAIAGTILAFYFVKLSYLFFACVPLSNAVPFHKFVQKDS